MHPRKTAVRIKPTTSRVREVSVEEAGVAWERKREAFHRRFLTMLTLCVGFRVVINLAVDE